MHIGLFTSTGGRLAPKPFWLGLSAVYLAAFASQALLTGAVLAHAGLWPFVIVQGALIWAWTALHIKRLRDAGQGPAGAIGIAAIYALAIGLMLLLLAFFLIPPAAGPDGEPAGSGMLGLFLVLAIFWLLFSPELGPFTAILKMLMVIALLPVVLSAAFTLYTGMRPPAISDRLELKPREALPRKWL